jgi:hypothetical protein
MKYSRRIRNRNSLFKVGFRSGKKSFRIHNTAAQKEGSGKASNGGDKMESGSGMTLKRMAETKWNPDPE